MKHTRYQVKINRCSCHPETCCCNPYLVWDTVEDKRLASFYNRKGAEDLATLLNSK